MQWPAPDAPARKSNPSHGVSTSSAALLRVVLRPRDRVSGSILPTAERSDDVRPSGDEFLRSAWSPVFHPSSTSNVLTEHYIYRQECTTCKREIDRKSPELAEFKPSADQL